VSGREREKEREKERGIGRCEEKEEWEDEMDRKPQT
jgi:hypothetical protein